MARNKYDVDEILEDKFDVNQLKRLAGYLKPHRKQMTVVLFLMLSASAHAHSPLCDAGYGRVYTQGRQKGNLGIRRPYHGDCALHLCQSAD